jgi:hypothetical protein
MEIRKEWVCLNEICTKKTRSVDRQESEWRKEWKLVLNNSVSDMCNECMSARLPLKMRTSYERVLLTVSYTTSPSTR